MTQHLLGLFKAVFSAASDSERELARKALADVYEEEGDAAFGHTLREPAYELHVVWGDAEYVDRKVSRHGAKSAVTTVRFSTAGERAAYANALEAYGQLGEANYFANDLAEVLEYLLEVCPESEGREAEPFPDDFRDVIFDLGDGPWGDE
jgi:hypothetical protein